MQLGRRRKARVSADSESIFYGVKHCVRHSSIWAPGLRRKIEELYVGQRSLLIFPARRTQRMRLPSRLGFSNPL